MHLHPIRPGRRHLLRGALAGLIAAALLVVGLATPAAAASTLTNAGFESGASQTPSGWSESGTTSASKTEAGGHSGSVQLAHWASSAYIVETYQTLTGLTSGQYTLSAWVRSGGGQRAAYLSCVTAAAPRPGPTFPPGGTWTQISVTATVSRASARSASTPTPSPTTGSTWTTSRSPARPATGSHHHDPRRRPVQPAQERGPRRGLLRPAGAQRGAVTILANAGANYARLKVWVNPADGYNNKARVLAMATRIKAAGMKLLIDFHYSDSWADPGKQVKPAAWSSYSCQPAARRGLQPHLRRVQRARRARARRPTWCRSATRSTPACCCPTGSTSNWANLAAFLTAGATAVKAANGSTRVMLHLGDGGDNALFRWWFDQAVARGVPFDVIGLSFYPYWHGSMTALRTNLNDMASRYQRDVVVAETAYGFTTAQDDAEPNIFNASLAAAGGFPATPQGQADELRAIYSAVRAVPNGRGLGVFYWEPAWTARAGAGWDPTNPTSGNGWENQAVFDYNDRALPALTVLGTGV